MLSDSKTGSDTNIPIRLFLRIFQWNFSSNFPFAFPSTIIIFSSGGLEKREALPRDVSPFWPEIRSIHGGRGNRKPGKEREREISFDSRHVEEIYSRIAYADRCAHLRSSFSGAVSSKCLDFCLDFRVLENLSMASLELCQVLAGMKVSPEMFARDEVSEGRNFCLESL